MTEKDKLHLGCGSAHMNGYINIDVRGLPSVDLKSPLNRLFDYFPQGTKINIAIGKGNAKVPKGTLCIGNCTILHRENGIFIPGCPPVGSQILTALSGEPSVDSRDGYIEKSDNFSLGIF